MNISGGIQGIAKVKKYLAKVPHGTKKAAIYAIAEYIKGDERHGFSHDNPYRKTTRKAVYGRSFESDAQRRYVMWMIRNGVWSGQRMRTPTDASDSYEIQITKGGYGANIISNSEGAYYTRIWRGWKTGRVIKMSFKAISKAH